MDGRIAGLIDHARVATLATISPGGAPHLVPVVFARAGTNLVTAVDGKPKKRTTLARIENIVHDPRVTVLVHNYEEDWSRLWWVRMDGRAAVVHHGEDFQTALAALRERYPQYGVVDLGGPVISIRIEKTAAWGEGLTGPSYQRIP